MNHSIPFLWAKWQEKTGETGARSGFFVYDCQTEQTLAWNADEWFIPASNNKLWTTAVALDQLGPDYGWETRWGVWKQTLWVVGSGDPVFGWNDLLQVADELKRKGITWLDGLILDESCFKPTPWGAGWMWEDLSAGFAAPVHGINFEMNRIPFVVDQTGTRPVLINPFPLIPATADGELTWSDTDETDVLIWREDEPYSFKCKGQLSRCEEEVEGAVLSGPLYFADACLAACKEAGIHLVTDAAVKVEPVRDEWIHQSSIVWTHRSPSLKEVIPLVNQESRNLVAEILLRTLARERDGIGSVESGKQIVLDTLKQWGVSLPGNYADGSGLSMYNLSSAKGFFSLLQKLVHHPHFSVFLDSLAQYGGSGTLKKRQCTWPDGWVVKAKTGTVYGVKTLSGYILEQGKIRYIFSFLINGLLKEKHGEEIQDIFLEWLISRQ